MTGDIHRIAALYQAATGIGLPFSGTREEMICALRESFENQHARLRALQVRDRVLRGFVSKMHDDIILDDLREQAIKNNQ